MVKSIESYLSWRAKRKRVHRAKVKKRGFVLDTLITFLQAVFIVVLLNQLLFQTFFIPSGSMIPTLLLKDRILVNKAIYGSELLPGVYKIPSRRVPARGEIVVFESPDYHSKGPMRELFQRLVYYLTLSFVDLNKDENGKPQVQFLIKRMIAKDGDRLRFRLNGMEIMPAGQNTWYPEEEFISTFQTTLKTTGRHRRTAGSLVPYQVSYKNYDEESMDRMSDSFVQEYYYSGSTQSLRGNSYYLLQYNISQKAYDVYPNVSKPLFNYSRLRNGWYIPSGYHFFMGDNRDNSLDSRSYGVVPQKNILGKGLLVFFPFSRMGFIH